jgi:hypothetical protein
VGRKIPDRESGEPLSSSGREERKVLCERTCMMKRSAQLRQSGIRAIISLFSVAEKKIKIHHAAKKRKTIT